MKKNVILYHVISDIKLFFICSKKQGLFIR